MSDALLAGRYRILSPLGASGIGEVFLSEDTRLERRVAVAPGASAGASVVHCALVNS